KSQEKLFLGIFFVFNHISNVRLFKFLLQGFPNLENEITHNLLPVFLYLYFKSDSLWLEFLLA
ncbi:hypothetical protein, partial [Flavobacterium sp. 3-210]